MRLKTVKELLRVVIGLAIFAYGVHLTIAANIGVNPWDVLGQGIAKHTPLNYGIAMTATSILVLLIDVLLRQPIGYGMLIDALLTGNLVQLYNDYGHFTNNLVGETLKLSGIPAVCASVVMMLIGIVFMAVGQAIYMGAGQSCGPRDTMLVGLALRFRKIPIGLIQNCILLSVFVVGWILGGSVGIGTVICVLLTGPVMEYVFKIMKFEPRKINHKNIIESTKILFGV
ncbi:MAG: hypothetical protein Q4C42_05825 [Clostridia bacterium]|nr:hypothetical protein [Clostridia bacterium]